MPIREAVLALQDWHAFHVQKRGGANARNIQSCPMADGYNGNRHGGYARMGSGAILVSVPVDCMANLPLIHLLYVVTIKNKSKNFCQIISAD
jgi:hypothetical protein